MTKTWEGALSTLALFCTQLCRRRVGTCPFAARVSRESAILEKRSQGTPISPAKSGFSCIKFYENPVNVAFVKSLLTNKVSNARAVFVRFAVSDRNNRIRWAKEGEMPRFDDQSLAAIQTFVDRSCEHFTSMGLIYGVDDDMTAWADWLSQQPHSHGVTKTHDPKLTHLDAGNSFWAHLKDTKGRVVACHAQRLIVTDDFLDDIVTQTAFFDRLPKIRLDELGLRLETKLMRISGRVGLGGGLYIHPDWRGRGLYNVLSRTTRAISVRHFKLDWYLAYFLTTQSRTQLGLEGAAFAHAIPLLSGIYPPYGRETDIQLMMMTREEALAQIRHDNQTAIGSVRYRVA